MCGDDDDHNNDNDDDDDGHSSLCMPGLHLQSCTLQWTTYSSVQADSCCLMNTAVNDAMTAGIAAKLPKDCRVSKHDDSICRCPLEPEPS